MGFCCRELRKSQQEVYDISAFGSKYFGWLACTGIILICSWFLLPSGYETLIAWLGPQLGNYVRPTLVMVNALLVNPLNNLTMVAIWAIAGLLGGMIAGKKAGAFGVGLLSWLCCLIMLGFCAVQLFMSGLDLGSLPPIPPGESLVYVLSIPLVQSAVGSLLGLISGGGGMPDITLLILPLIVWFFTPLIIVTVAAIIGATIRKKE